MEGNQKPFTQGDNIIILLFTFEKKAFRLYRLALAWCGGVPSLTTPQTQTPQLEATSGCGLTQSLSSKVLQDLRTKKFTMAAVLILYSSGLKAPKEPQLMVLHVLKSGEKL